MTDNKEAPREQTRSQQEFLKAAEPLQQLVRAVLREERDVMHLRRRSEIYQKILDHVRQRIP
ncbi:MAG: hypothetical protein C5B50_05355 [Verrucomicrobia bacterium]|nr:MAG: hypothetical protein C5B50_05355 [Verrucomicrobiota bacterium]